MQRAAILALALAATVFVGWLDHTTAQSLALSPFYLVPIAVAAWRAGSPGTEIVVFAAVAAGFISERDHDYALGTTVLNGLARAVVYGGVAGLIARLRSARDELAVTQERLQEALRREMATARTDALTGLANRRGFLEALGRLVESGATDLSVAYLDLDDFKSVNDRYGHHAGDAFLREVADRLRHVVRTGDLCARLGGDEFAVVFRRAPPKLVHAALERLMEAVREAADRFPHARAGVSVGVVYFRKAPASVEALIGQADAAMYRAKTAGKGRIVSERAVAEFVTVEA